MMMWSKLIQAISRRLWRRGPGNLYQGVYSTLEEAKRRLGPGRVGYDNDLAAGFYRERLDRLYTDDYPILFWLRPLIAESTRVVDFGGHVGLHFYAYRKVLGLPASLRWTVIDVPAVCRAGEALAAERGVAGQLQFSSGPISAVESDVLLSSGALQYLEPQLLARSLAEMKQPPRHLLLGKLPVRDGPGLFTIQDTGVFRATYSIFSRSTLIASLQSLRYELVDAWSNPGHHCRIAGAPEHSVNEYSGFYFRVVT